MSSRNNILNFLKGIACIGVIFIHVPFPTVIGKLISLVCAYAVPVFYLIAGYYSFDKNENVIKKRLHKIARIFIFAFFIYFVQTFAFALFDGYALNWLSSNFNCTALIKSIIFCTINFAVPLWYLIAQIETYILWYVVVKYNKQKDIVKVMPLLFILYIVITTVCETYGLRWFWKINFMTRSLNWFLLGYYLHSIPTHKLEKIKNQQLLMAEILGCVLIVLPTLCSFNINFSCIGYLPLAMGLFIFCIKYPAMHLNEFVEYIGNELSLWIYIFHMPINIFLERAINKFSGEMNFTVQVFYPLLVVVITLGFSYIFNSAYKKIKSYKVNSK